MRGVNEIAGRYATALFDLALQQGRLEKVAQDLTDIAAMLTKSEALSRLVNSPVIARADQKQAMGQILTKMHADDLTQKFVGYVAQNRRLFALKPMIAAYLKALAAHRGEVTAEVMTAYALTDQQRGVLQQNLRDRLQKSVALVETINPEIIGGLVIRVGSQMFDASVRTQIQKLKLVMKEA